VKEVLRVLVLEVQPLGYVEDKVLKVIQLRYPKEHFQNEGVVEQEDVFGTR